MHLGCLDHVLQAGFKLLAEGVDAATALGSARPRSSNFVYFGVVVFGSAIVTAEIKA